MPGFQIKLNSTTNCKSGPGIIYHAVCTANNSHCKLAHYVGRAWSSDPVRYPMRARWANHKSHPKMGKKTCEMSKHLIQYHKHEDPQEFVKVQILEQLSTIEETKAAELLWTRKLFAFHPSGLNKREETVD